MTGRDGLGVVARGRLLGLAVSDCVDLASDLELQAPLLRQRQKLLAREVLDGLAQLLCLDCGCAELLERLVLHHWYIRQLPSATRQSNRGRAPPRGCPGGVR